MDLDAEASFLPEALSAAGARARSKPAQGWESYYGDLRKFVARQLGTRQDADDVVQEIYQELLHSRCAEATNPRAWLWKIAWRVVHDAFERQKRHRLHLVSLDPKSIKALQASRLSAVAPIDTQLEAQDELLQALEGLPPATQIAIVRSRRDGWTYEQIAVELGVTPHMVKNHIGRAIAHFHAYFEQADRQSAEQGVSP
jgi:RNA polymerase sigma factor (sigma-70 family)